MHVRSLSTLAVVACAGPASAALIPAAVTSNTPDFRPASNVSNFSGLSGDPNGPGGAGVTHGSWREGNSWVTLGNIGDDYFEAVAQGLRPVPVLTFDLGADTEIDGFAFWAYSGSEDQSGENNSAKDIELLFATEADGLGGFGTSITDNPGYGLAKAVTFGASARQDFTLPSAVTARYVRVTVTDNFFGFSSTRDGGNAVGIAELLFNEVPTPGAAALLGLAGLGAARRRR